MSSNSHSEKKNGGSNEGSVKVDRGTNSGVYSHEPIRPLERLRRIGSETGTPSTSHTPLPFLSATANAQEPNDPYFQGTAPTTFNHQWGLKNTGQTPPGATRPDSDIDAEVAWGFETGDYGTVIAIIDTGVPLESNDNVWDSFDLSHPDLDNNIKVVLGSDWTNTGKGVRDDNGHGTHVAGIAGAETDNGVGVSGVCWDC
jgi:subtilisin family serine protease